MDNSLNNNQSILIGGRSGMGRKTCVQLVSFLNGLEYYSLSVGRDYGIREFRKELKVFLEQVGG
jgi:dynein heavy chain 2